MAKDPTKDPEFKRVLGNLLKAPPKSQEEMKLGAPRNPQHAKPKRKSKRAKPSR